MGMALSPARRPRLRSGGTWMGVSDKGRFAVAPNARGCSSQPADRESRGLLVVELLSHPEKRFDGHFAARFNAFTVLVADSDEAVFATNRPRFSKRRLRPGVYRLSNGGLDEPWRKAARLTAGV